MENIHTILRAYVVVHNMIIEDKRAEEHADFLFEAGPLLTVQRGSMPWADYLAATKELESTNRWTDLRHNLVEHLWERKGEVLDVLYVDPQSFKEMAP